MAALLWDSFRQGDSCQDGGECVCFSYQEDLIFFQRSGWGKRCFQTKQLCKYGLPISDSLTLVDVADCYLRLLILVAQPINHYHYNQPCLKIKPTG